MLSLLMFILKFIPNLLGFLGKKNDNQKDLQLADMNYQIEFLKATAGWETQVVRQLIVLVVAYSIFAPVVVLLLRGDLIGALSMMKEQVSGVPVVYWFILLWEFVGKDAFYLLPYFRGFKNGNGNGGKGDVETAVLPTTTSDSPTSSDSLPSARVDDPDNRKGN